MVKIGIIGVGYVGGALREWFENHPERFRLFVYDKYKELGSPEEVNQANIIFVAVPTPFHFEENRYDDSAVVETLENIDDGKVVVIKSTITPGSTERFQKRHPKKIILFSPEFLRAKTAVNDFLNPERQIMGIVDEAHRKCAEELFELLPRAPYEKVLHATEAEMVKFFGNTYLATRVIFANQMYDVCEKLGVNYDNVREAVSRDARIGGSHLDVLCDDYRGYGGIGLQNSACFPKDMKAFIQFADSIGVDLQLHKKADELNEKLRETHG